MEEGRRMSAHPSQVANALNREDACAVNPRVHKQILMERGIREQELWFVVWNLTLLNSGSFATELNAS